MSHLQMRKYLLMACFHFSNNKHSKKRKIWPHQFQTRSAKQAREVVFSRNVLKAAHRLVTFCKYIVSQALSQKHIDVTLDERLRFEEHLK